MADQLTPGALPAYGGRSVDTPHIDALAAAGVVFDAAYCNTPLCAPSRAVMMTGRLPSATGVYDNAAEFSSQLPSFAHCLRSGGYRTILSGKMHFCGPDQLHGFEERLTTDIYPADYGWTPDWRRFDERPEWYHNMESVTKAGPCARTNQLDFDEEVVFHARQKLFDMARDRDGRPFCLVVSMSHPHDPFTITEPYWDRIDPARVTLPVTPAAGDPHSRRIRHVIGLDLETPSEAQILAARRAYYGAIAYLDDQVGVLVATLAQTRLDQQTIVILLSDHGEFLGEHGLWYKMSFLEPASRIPLIVSAPNAFSARRVTRAVSLVDLLPTLAELGAAPLPPTPPDGRSLMPHLSGTGGHDEVIGEYLAESVVAPMVMIRRGSAKFIHTPGDPDLLFDLAADPSEQAPIGDATRLAPFHDEAARRWDFPALADAVLASQARRAFVASALAQGRKTHWDYQPVREASQMYVRAHMKLDDIEAMARFPRV